MSTRSPRTLNRPRGIPSPRQRRISALARLRRNTARRRHRHILRSPARHRQPQGDLQAEHAALPAIGHACGHNLTAAASLAALLGRAAALAASPRPAACGCSARRPKKAAAANSSWSPRRARRVRGARRGRGCGAGAGAGSTDQRNVRYVWRAIHPLFGVEAGDGCGNHTAGFAECRGPESAFCRAVDAARGSAAVAWRMWAGRSFALGVAAEFEGGRGLLKGGFEAE